MNDYSDNMNNIQNKTLYNIEEEYKEMISEYRKKINVKIQDCIEETFRGIPDGKIEDWIEELFLDDFKIVENHNFKKIEQILDEYKYKIPIGLENGRDLSRLINEYQEELKDVFKKHNIYNLEDLISEFSRQISNKISYYLEVFKGISDYNIENKIDELKYSLRRRLESVMTEYYEEYQFKIVNLLNKNIKSIQENVNDIEETKQIPKEILEIFEENMIYSGYKLIIENNIIYAQELKSLEMIELKYIKEETKLTNETETLEFCIKNGKYYSKDKNKNKKIYIGSEGKYKNDHISDYDNKYHLTIRGYKDNFSFWYGDKRIYNLTEINIIISMIKNKSPEYYNKLLQETAFKKIAMEAKEYADNIEEISYNKELKQVILNSKTKEKLNFKLRLIGCEIKEKEDGIYIADSITKKESKINYNFGKFEASELCVKIESNINYVTPDTIFNLSILERGKNSIAIFEDINYFSITIENESYGIIIEEDKIKYTSKNKLQEPEIIEIVKKEYPLLIEYVEQQKEKIKKAKRQEDIKELKDIKNSLLKTTNIESQDIIATRSKK